MTPIERLLDAANVEVHGTQKQSEVTLCCPFCAANGFSADVNFHLGLNTYNGKAHCFRCDWKSSGALYTAKQLRRAYEIEFAIPEREMRTAARQAPKPVLTAPESVDLPAEYETFNSSDFVGRRVLRYLDRRGVSLSQIVRHKIGYAASGKYAWRALFPVIGRDKKIYGCVGRGITKEQEPKYLNSPGLKMLWNTLRVESTAVVVEGIMDALTVERALMQCIGISAVARLGSTITSIQLDQLREYSKIIIFPDFDLAGARGAVELAKRASDAGINVHVVVPDTMTGEDPGGMKSEPLLQYIGNAVKWTTATEHRLRLASVRRSRG